MNGLNERLGFKMLKAFKPLKLAVDEIRGLIEEKSAGLKVFLLHLLDQPFSLLG